MKTRLTTLLALLSLGFAPAPFLSKKAKRDSADADLAAIQGVWFRTDLTMDGRHRPDRCRVEIKGKLMQFPSRSDAWNLAFDDRAEPRRLSATKVGGGTAFWGVYKREGDTLVICWTMGKEADRATSFDPMQKGAWLQVFRRSAR
ncbi:MAG: hypothetical protein K2W96_09915 [Gemmataceae bacterium]|nr:hypothetical protein [Gemmataceae bacterium]